MDFRFHPFLQRFQLHDDSDSEVEEVRDCTLRISDLELWMDEKYLMECFYFTHKTSFIEVVRNPETRQSKGYGLIECVSPAAAEEILKRYNGTPMPVCGKPFKLSRETFDGEPERGHDDPTSGTSKCKAKETNNQCSDEKPKPPGKEVDESLRHATRGFVDADMTSHKRWKIEDIHPYKKWMIRDTDYFKGFGIEDTDYRRWRADDSYTSKKREVAVVPPPWKPSVREEEQLVIVNMDPNRPPDYPLSARNRPPDYPLSARNRPADYPHSVRKRPADYPHSVGKRPAASNRRWRADDPYTSMKRGMVVGPWKPSVEDEEYEMRVLVAIEPDSESFKGREKMEAFACFLENLLGNESHKKRVYIEHVHSSVFAVPLTSSQAKKLDAAPEVKEWWIGLKCLEPWISTVSCS